MYVETVEGLLCIRQKFVYVELVQKWTNKLRCAIGFWETGIYIVCYSMQCMQKLHTQVHAVHRRHFALRLGIYRILMKSLKNLFCVLAWYLAYFRIRLHSSVIYKICHICIYMILTITLFKPLSGKMHINSSTYRMFYTHYCQLGLVLEYVLPWFFSPIE